MKSTKGRPRKITDAQVAAIMTWHCTRKTLRQMAQELGVSPATVQNVIKCGGQFKQPSPELREAVIKKRRTRLKALAAGGWL